VLITGWQCFGLLQMLDPLRGFAAYRFFCAPKPMILRARSWPVRLPHRLIACQAAALCDRKSQCPLLSPKRKLQQTVSGRSSYFVDNQFFAERAQSSPHSEELP